MTSKRHWKAESEPNYFGTFNFGEDRKDIIDEVLRIEKRELTGSEGAAQNKLVAVLRYGLPLVLNVSNSKTMEKITGSPYLEDWEGVWIQLYITKVKAFGGGKTDGVRIRSAIPPLTEKHPMWEPVIKSIQEGKRTIESVEKTFTIPATTKESIKKLTVKK